MLEKDMENLIAKHPDEFFPNSGFNFVGQQENLSQRRVDIVFNDKYDRTIIIEIKRGVLSREAAGQVMEYYGLLKKEKPEMTVELILCANTIPHERREFLERHGIECKEIGVPKFEDVAKKVGYKFIEDKKIEEPVCANLKEGDIVKASGTTTIENFIEWLSINLIELKMFSTLGGRSDFHAKYNKNAGSITMINSKENSYEFSKEQIIATFERWNTASPSNKYKTTYYERQIWNNILSKYRHFHAPAIPAIIRDWVEEQ